MAIGVGTAMAASAGASLISSGINAASQSNLNRRNRKFAREMWDKQGAREVEFWDMQNRYNDPSAQMQRLQAAGLNPNLVYGTGATTEAAGLSPKPVANPSTSAPRVDIGSVVGQALNARMTQASIDRTEAETRRINEDTREGRFMNDVRDMVSREMYASRELSNIDKSAYDASMSEKQLMKYNDEYDAWRAAAFSGAVSTIDPNSPISKAYKAGFERTVQDLDNAKKLGDIRAAEAAIKAFEKRLTDQGISPNSPWFVKIIDGILERMTDFYSRFPPNHPFQDRN